LGFIRADAQNTATNDFYRFEVYGAYRKLSGTLTISELQVEVIANPTGIAYTYATLTSASGAVFFYVNGHAATDIWWRVRADVEIIPTV